MKSRTVSGTVCREVVRDRATRNEVSQAFAGAHEVLHRDRPPAHCWRIASAIAAEPGVSRNSSSLARSQSFWPGGGLTAERLAQRGQSAASVAQMPSILAGSCGIKRAREQNTGGSVRLFAFATPAARVEIVAGLSMIHAANNTARACKCASHTTHTPHYLPF